MVESLYSAVWTDSLHKADFVSSLKVNPVIEFQPAIHVHGFKMLQAVDILRKQPVLCEVLQTFMRRNLIREEILRVTARGLHCSM